MASSHPSDSCRPVAKFSGTKRLIPRQHRCRQHRCRVLAWLLLLALTLLGAAEAAELRSDDGPDATFESATMTWTIWNSRIRAEFRLVPLPSPPQSQPGGQPSGDQGAPGVFRLVSLSLRGEKVWRAPVESAASPISLRINDQMLDDLTAWRHVGTTETQSARQGLRQAITLRSDAARVEITLNLEVHPNQPFLRYWMELKNNDGAERFLTAANILHWRFDTNGQLVMAFYVNQYRLGEPFHFDLNEVELPWVPEGATVFSGAHGDHCSWLALNTPDGFGLVTGWEFDGRAHVTARQGQVGAPLEISGGPDDLHLGLGTGQVVTLPAAFLGLFRGDWDEAGYRTHRYVEGVLAEPMPDDAFPYLMYDTWGYETNIDEGLVRRLADLAATLGVEVFIVDLGWARQIGEWEDDAGRFPGGLRAFADYLRSLNMKFGLHWTPAEVAPEAPVLRDNPDWPSSRNNGYFGAASICLGHRPAQEWARQTLLDLVERYQIDWLTQDGENLVKRCDKATHTHGAENSNWANSVEGIDALVKFARERVPRMLWENNADGGSMSTFEAVKRYATFSSCDACEQLERRQSVYGMSYVFPPRFIDRYMGDWPSRLANRSSMFGGPWILMGRMTDWGPEEIDLVRRDAAIYKSLRPLLREGKVYHLLRRPDGLSIEAMESFHSGLDRGVIFVYRPNSPDSSKTIFPRGLAPAHNYRVTFQESREARYDNGANLMASGIQVQLPTKQFAEIVYLNGQ